MMSKKNTDNFKKKNTHDVKEILMKSNPKQMLLHHRSKPPMKPESPNPRLPVPPAPIIIIIINYMMKSHNDI